MTVAWSLVMYNNVIQTGHNSRHNNELKGDFVNKYFTARAMN